MRGLALLAVLAVVALSACGEDPGLRTAAQMHVGYLVRCGDVVYWDAGALANDAHKDAVVRGVRLIESREFAVAGVRARYDMTQSVAGTYAKTAGIGLHIPPTDKDPARAWHLIVGLRTQACTSGARVFSLPAKALQLRYDLGGDHRTLRLGDEFDVCAKRGRAHCPRY